MTEIKFLTPLANHENMLIAMICDVFISLNLYSCSLLKPCFDVSMITSSPIVLIGLQINFDVFRKVSASII